MTADELIELYQRAYERANGERRYAITFEGSWYVLRRKGSFIVGRYRRKKIEEMREELLSRPPHGARKGTA